MRYHTITKHSHLDMRRPRSANTLKSRWPAFFLLLAILMFSSHASAKPKKGARKRQQTSTTLTGQVRAYLLNPFGDVEGLILADGTTARFPHHLGDALVALVKPGDAVKVIGISKARAHMHHASGLKATNITSSATGRTLADQPPASPPIPPHLRGIVLKPLSLTGSVETFLVDPKGEVDGLLLNSGEQVGLGKHAGRMAAPFLSAGSRVSAQGYGTSLSLGTAIKAEQLVLPDGRTLVVAGKRSHWLARGSSVSPVPAE